MEKRIVLRYATVCRKCRATMAAGSSAYWLGSGRGVRHISCPGNQTETEINKPNISAPVADRMTYDFHDIRSVFLEITAAGEYGNSNIAKRFPINERRVKSLRDMDWGNTHWMGCSVPEQIEWLQSGYHVTGLDGISGLIPARPKRKLIYGEEGDELLIDLVQSGDDKPFIEWEKRNTKPGLSLEIHTVVNAHYPAAVMTQYQRWIARAMQTLDENGVDMEVNLVMPNGNLWSQGSRTETLIRVRRPGEAIDFAGWSAMFSPGGYRHLGFTAWNMHAEDTGHTVHGALGSALDYKKWTVEYDDVSNVVVIGNDQNVREFPEAEMTDKLVAILAKLTG